MKKFRCFGFSWRKSSCTRLLGTKSMARKPSNRYINISNILPRSSAINPGSDFQTAASSTLDLKCLLVGAPCGGLEQAAAGLNSLGAELRWLPASSDVVDMLALDLEPDAALAIFDFDAFNDPLTLLTALMMLRRMRTGLPLILVSKHVYSKELAGNIALAGLLHASTDWRRLRLVIDEAILL